MFQDSIEFYIPVSFLYHVTISQHFRTNCFIWSLFATIFVLLNSLCNYDMNMSLFISFILAEILIRILCLCMLAGL